MGSAFFEKLLHRAFYYDRVRRIMEEDPDQSAIAFVERSREEFSVRVQIVGDLPHNARSTIFLSTHHTGALDFAAVFPPLARSVDNLKVVMNHRLLALGPLREVAIPVYPLSSKRRNVEGKAAVKEHLKAGGNVLVFPAGKVANARGNKVEDMPWRKGIMEVAQECSAQVVPIYVAAQNSRFFYTVRRWLPRLSLLFLLRYMERRGKPPVIVVFGEPVPRESLKSEDASSLAATLHRQTHALADRIQPQ